MLKKTDIINAVNEIEGEDIDFQILQDKLQLLQKIAQGEQDIKEGRVYTTEQLKATIDSWRQSRGQQLPRIT
jgi:predicted transcriptional regulator